MLLRRVPSCSAGMESCKRSLCMNRRYQRESFENSLVRYSTGASPSSGPSASSPPSAQPETRRGALPGAYDLHGYGRCRSLLLGIANMDNVRCKHVAARDRGRHRDSSSVRGHSAAGRTAAHIGRVATTASMPWKPTTAQADCGLQLICRGRALVPIGRNDWARQKPCRRRRRPPLVRGSVVVARGWSVGVGPGGRRRSIGLLSPTHLSWRLEMAKRRDARDVDGQSCDTDPDVPTGPCAVTRRPACQKPRPESSGAASNRSPPRAIHISGVPDQRSQPRAGTRRRGNP